MNFDRHSRDHATFICSFAALCIASVLLGAPSVMAQEESPWASLIDITVYDTDGSQIHGFRYDGIEPHHYTSRNKNLAGEFKDGRYTCYAPDGDRAVEIGCEGEHLKVWFSSADGGPLEMRTGSLATVEGFFEIRSGTAFFWYGNGQIAVEAILPQGIWTAWGTEIRADPWFAYKQESFSRFSSVAVPRLIKGLSHEDRWVRARAAEALTALAPRARSAVTALNNCLGDEFWLVRRAAAEALGRMGAPAAEAVPILAELLAADGEDPGVRRAAARALGTIRGEHGYGIPALLEVLSKSDCENGLRSAVVACLAAAGPQAKAAIPALLDLAKSEDAMLRIAALVAIRKVDPSAMDVIDELASALSNGDEEIRVAAARAIGDIGPDALKIRSKLANALNATDREWTKGGAAAYAIADALHRVQPDSPELAGWSLPGPSPDYPQIPTSALTAVCMVVKNPEFMIELLNERLGSGDYYTRAEAERALGEIGPEAKAMVPALVYMLGDNSIPLRDWACKALGRIGKEALPVLRKALGDARYLRRWSASEALGRIGKDAVPVLMEALESNESYVQREAASALGGLGSDAKAAVPALKGAMSTADSTLQDIMAEVLARIEGQ